MRSSHGSRWRSPREGSDLYHDIRVWLRTARPARVGLILALLSAAILIYLNRGMWFFGDDFAFIMNRYSSMQRGDWESAILSPHNEHTAIVPAALYLLIQSVFGLHHPILFALPMIVAHAAIVYTITVLLLKTLSSRALALAGALAVVFLTGGTENLYWAFQVGFVGALACGITLVLIAYGSPDTSRSTWGAAALGVLSVALTTHGLVFVVLAAVVLAARRMWRKMVWVVAPPVVLFGLWYVAYGTSATHSGPTWRQRLQLPQYVWEGLVRSADAVLHLRGTGVVILLVSITVALLSWGKEWFLPALLALGAVVFFTLTGFGRVHYGIDQAGSSRYVYIGVVMLAPLVFLALDQLLRVSSARTWTAAVLALWLLMSGITGFLDSSIYRRGEQGKRLRAMTASAEIARSFPEIVEVNAAPSPQFNPNVLVADVVRLQDQGQWPDVDYGQTSLIRAATYVSLSVRASSEETLDVSPDHAGWLVRATARLRDDECVVVAPRADGQLIVEPLSLDSFTVSTDFDGLLQLQLEDAETGWRGDVREFSVEGGLDYMVQGWLPDTRLIVGLDPGTEIVVCGISLNTDPAD